MKHVRQYVNTFINIMLRHINANNLYMSILCCTFAVEKVIRRGTAATEHKKL